MLLVCTLHVARQRRENKSYATVEKENEIKARKRTCPGGAEAMRHAGDDDDDEAVAAGANSEDDDQAEDVRGVVLGGLGGGNRG